MSANHYYQPPFDNFIPVIPTQDPQMHTVAQPFCKVDPSCICHEDQENISVVNEQVRAGLVTPSEATRIVQGTQI